ncbi:hypothetical protein [Microcoleus sp. S13_C5]|uniref:hypothetical protein n=1 Tax=Microcoleus sp. S13_C5 TaxID=3055411 RepID=UPI002FD6CDFA
MLLREDVLWCQAVQVSQQALSKRFVESRAELFERVMMELLPQLHTRWLSGQQRKLPVSLSLARRHFQQIWVVDGSTLEAIFRKLSPRCGLAP